MTDEAMRAPSANVAHAHDAVFDHYDPEQERGRECLMALGNGTLMMRAAAPESQRPAADHPSQPHYVGLYYAGLYDRSLSLGCDEPGGAAQLVNLPDPFGLSFRALGNTWEGEWFCLETAELLCYRQRLDMQAGLGERELRFRDKDGRETELIELRWVSQADAALAALRWTLRPLNWSGRVQLRSTVDASVRNANTRLRHDRRKAMRSPDRDVGIGIGSDRLVVSVRRGEPGRWVAVGARLQLQGGAVDDAASRRIVETKGRLLTDMREVEVRCGKPVTVDKLAVVIVQPGTTSAAARAAVEARANDALEAAPDLDRQLQAHRGAWASIWRQIPIEIADARVARPVRFHMFHLLQTASPLRHEQDVGLPARGWQEQYGGHIFWDDLLASPFLAMHFPEIARRLVRYRYRRLPAARERARRAGLQGAMFPWRSAVTGEEETPRWQLNPLSGQWIRDHTELQRHIGSAIAYSVWQLWLATGDIELMAQDGGELLIEIARFWSSCAQWDPHHQRFRILGVVGPDEFHMAYPGAAVPGVDDNAYTNVMASWTLARAIDLMTSLPEERSRALRNRLAVRDAELADWDRVSRALRIVFRPDGILDQFDGYGDLKPYPAALLGAHPDSRADWLLEARAERADAYQVSKQPDVLMLMHLFAPDALSALLTRMGYAFDEEGCRRTADYYLARTAHDSSLSHVGSAGALAALDLRASWRYFEHALKVDLGAPRPSPDGPHLSAMAGTLDVLLRHYLGVRCEEHALAIRPRLPHELGDLSWAGRYRGLGIRIWRTAGAVWVQADAGNARPLPVRLHANEQRELAAGDRALLASELSRDPGPARDAAR